MKILYDLKLHNMILDMRPEAEISSGETYQIAICFKNRQSSTEVHERLSTQKCKVYCNKLQ